MNMVCMDDVDLKLVHALQVAGRASFREIADALGLSERMISRRYARLRSTLRLRVVGTTDPLRLRQLDWFVRVRVTVGSVDTVVTALASHDDVSWVSTLAGAPEVTCIVRSRSVDRGEISPVIVQLQRSPHVTAVTAQCLLAPIAGVGGWPGRISSLTCAEETALNGMVGDRDLPARRLPLSDAEEMLIRALREDGRASVSRLSRALNMPDSTVRRRIADLTGQGVLRFEVDIDPRLYGRALEAICWLEVEPHGIGNVAAALGTHPHIAFAATTTGVSTVIAILELADARELHGYLSESLGALSAIRRVETALVERRIKRASAVDRMGIRVQSVLLPE